MPLIVRQIIDLIIVFQRNQKKHYHIKRYTLIVRVITISETLKCKK